MNQPISPDEKFKRELYQQAHAIFAVYNPTDKDYQLIFDRRVYIIPNQTKDFGKGKGIEYMSAYLAKKYATEMTNKILQDRAMQLVAEENERRREAGMALLTKYPSDNPQEVIEEQVKINDQTTRAEVMRTLIRGMVQKAPEDMLLREEESRQDTTIPMDDQIFNTLGDTPYDANPPTPIYQAPINMNAAKENLITNLEKEQHETQEPSI